MEYKVVGISAIPVRDGNVQTFFRHMPEHAKNGGSNTEEVHLSDYNVGAIASTAISASPDRNP